MESGEPMTKSMRPPFFARFLLGLKIFFVMGVRQHRIFGILVHCETNPKENDQKIHDALVLIKDFDDALFSFVTHHIWGIYFFDEKPEVYPCFNRKAQLVKTVMWTTATPLFLAAALVRFASYLASSEDLDFVGAKKAQLIFLMKLGTDESRELAEHLNSSSNPKNLVDDLSVLESAEIINRKDRYY